MRNVRAWLLLPLLPLVLGAAAARSAKPVARPVAAPGAVLVIEPMEIEATDLQWRFDVLVRNASDRGLYCDSVVGHFEDQDPGDTRTPRAEDMPLNAARMAFAEISAGDSLLSAQTMPA